MTENESEHPDIEAAKAELERVKRRRPAVKRLVDALVLERGANHFAENLFGPYPGGRR